MRASSVAGGSRRALWVFSRAGVEWALGFTSGDLGFRSGSLCPGHMISKPLELGTCAPVQSESIQPSVSCPRREVPA